jgi:galactan endo-1,6-beta-galactosidase
MILLPALALAAQTATVRLDPARSRGPWEGWGTSLCWMGNPFGERADLADLLFARKTATVEGRRLPGLGLNIVRYNAGACGDDVVDGRRMLLSPNVLPFRRMEGFWRDGKSADPRSASWDWTRDKGQRTMMLNAKRRGADRFELFSNSPMWWMCANDNPSGAAKATDDNLRPDMRGAFATYLATIAAEAPRRWGVRFTSVEPFNEPASDYWSATGRQEGCHFSPATQAAFLPVLRAELDRRGLRSLPIAASDETSFSHALATWNAFDAPTRALVGQANVHGYQNSPEARRAFFAALGDKRRWNSERGDGDATGLSTARELALDVNVLRVSAWCYWQPLDGGGWGLLDCDLPAAAIRGVNPKLYVLAHYTRHVRPGMAILDTNDPAVVAAYDRKRRRLVIVAVREEEAGSKTFDLSGFALSRPRAARWVTEPKGEARYRKEADLRVEEDALVLPLPSGSVQTVEIDGVSIRG